MIYDIKINGVSIWNDQPANRLISPVVEIELNTAGRLQFTMPPNHPYFDEIRPMQDTVEVFENGTSIFFGRPTELERDTKNYKSAYCEGALAYFNDSAQRPRVAGNVTAADLFNSIVDTHNTQCAAGRRFVVGTVSMPSTPFGWENDYISSMSAITSLLDHAGGYIIPRRSGGVNYLDYISELPEVTTQPVQFGLNMLEFDRQYTLADIATCVLPLGAISSGSNEPITIASVNGGNDILMSETAVQTYGKIVKILRYDKISDPQELKDKAAEYLSKVQFDPISIQISAAELSFLSNTYGPFRIGTTIHAVSEPHWLDKMLPITKMTIPMDRAAKQITLGTVTARSITEAYTTLETTVKKTEEAISSGKIGPGSGDDIIHKFISTAHYQQIVDSGTVDANSIYFVHEQGEETDTDPIHRFVSEAHYQQIVDSGTVDANSIYFVHDGTEETYTVTFLNGETVLLTVEGVYKHDNVTYTGETPVDGDKRFVGWEPSPNNILGDLTCNAVFDES